MPTNDYSKNIVYLSKEQYQELITNETLTVNGQTITYNDNDIYVTPQAEPVTDVRINGTSIINNGVANVPVADYNLFGVVKFSANQGIYKDSNNDVMIVRATQDEIKEGSHTTHPITPARQHRSVFYGLAKAAGDSTQSASANAVGNYTNEAKGAIQKMLGVSDLIATEENNLIASKAYAVGDVFTANGKLYKATAAIAADAAIIPAVEGEEIAGANCEETSVGEGFVKWTDYACNTTPQTQKAGIIGVTPVWSGIRIATDGGLYLNVPNADLIKIGVDNSRTSLIHQQHIATFYGLAKAAGDTTQSASDNAVGTYTDEAKAAIKSMIGVNVEDVQVNGTSVVNDGVANIPTATGARLGVVRAGMGLQMAADGERIATKYATDAGIKNASQTYEVITPINQHTSVFYGLAKAAGDTTQSASSNTIGTYTDEAKLAIQTMLGIDLSSIASQVEIPLVETVDGAAVTITGQPNTRYICGEVTSISITPPAAGSIDVIFTSGSTVAVLTLPSTVKMPEWFDATALETNTIYEILITDGTYGSVMTWAN